MGLTTEQVQLLEISSDPPKSLLLDWSGKSNDATIENLISMLRELERLDIISEIYKYFQLPEPNTDPSQVDQKDSGVDGSTRNGSMNEEMPHCSGDINTQSFRMLQVDTSPKESNLTDQRPGSASSQRAGASYSNDSSITVAKRGVSNLTMTDEAVGYSATLGTNLSCVEGSTLLPLTEHNITPVE